MYRVCTNLGLPNAGLQLQGRLIILMLSAGADIVGDLAGLSPGERSHDGGRHFVGVGSRRC